LVPLVCGKELFSELVPLPNPGGKFPLCSLSLGMMAGGEESFFESVNGERQKERINESGIRTMIKKKPDCIGEKNTSTRTQAGRNGLWVMVSLNIL
jgi:hypothetical protein